MREEMKDEENRKGQRERLRERETSPTIPAAQEFGEETERHACKDARKE